MQLKALVFRFPRSAGRFNFIPGVLACVEAVPASGTRGVSCRNEMWVRTELLIGAVSRISTEISWPLFASLALSEGTWKLPAALSC